MRKYLTICVLICSIMFSLIPAYASESSSMFSVGVPNEIVKEGDTFEVAVELSNNTGFCAIGFALSYDDTVMKCDNVIMNEVLSGALTAANSEKNGVAVVSAASLKAIKSDGVLALFVFTAKKDIADFKFMLNDILLADIDGRAIEYKIQESVDGENNSSDSGNPEDFFVDNGNADADKDISSGTENVPEPVFPDVVGHWAEKYVALAAKQGLFMGDTDGNFNPDDNVTRAQFVTVLWRMAGRPDVDAELPFADVEKEISEFKSAIKWGYESGHIKGTSDTTFEPRASLTREAGMKILHSYSGGKIGEEIQVYAVYDGIFKDSTEISDWAKPSIYWGIYNKLISGTSNVTLTPKGTATRAQLATILVNYLDIK